MPVRPAYEAWAQIYDEDPNPTRDLDARVLRAADLPLEGSRIVEIGAGTGKNTVYLAQRARSVIALDLSPAMLARARARTADHPVRCIQHDITRPWPVDDEAADLVIGDLVLEHIAELGPVFREARRVLRAGGLLYLAEHHPYRQLAGSRPRFDLGSGAVEVETHLHMISDYLNAARRAGFSLLRLDEHFGPAGEGLDGAPRLLTMVFTRA